MADGPPDFGAVRSVFEQALDLPPAERIAFLDRACGVDEGLRREVDELLVAAEEAGASLEPPTRNEWTQSIAGWRDDQLVGREIEGFAVQRLLAVGGMGVVYEAEQRTPRRRVAIKALRALANHADTERRFRYEAEVLAKLEHPHIARIYAAGILDADDLPPVRWIALEFVEGARNMVESCAAHAANRDQRITAMLDVCAAVQHAHQRGVIHRDLKADNVLVGGDGVIKVIDFGVARVAAGSFDLTALHTQRGQVVGTLAAMSPEQVAGRTDEIDTRTDVYALGLLLYRLLVGSAPYDLDGKSLPEAARTICEQPPDLTPPVLAGDLGVVLGKVLAKEPERRYASVAAFAEDLERILRNEPIAARPPSLGYQIARLGRRHRALLGTAVVISAVSLGAAFFSQRSAAEAHRQRARGDQLFQTFVDRSLEKTFDYAVRIHLLPNAAPISTDMIRVTIEDLEQLEANAESDALREKVVIAYTRLGEVQGLHTAPNLGDPESARRSFERAVDLARALVSETRGAATPQRLLSRALRMLGQLDLQLGQIDAAESRIREAVDLIDPLCAADPSDLDVRACAAYGHDFFATAFIRKGDLDAAEQHRERAAALFAALRTAQPERERWQHQRVNVSFLRAGDIYHRGRRAEDAGDAEGARAAYARARAEALSMADLVDEATALNARSARLFRAKSAWWAGTMALLLQEPEVAEADLDRALQIYVDLADEEPKDLRWQQGIGATARSLGNTARKRAEQENDAGVRTAHLRRACERYRQSLAAWHGLADRSPAIPKAPAAVEDVTQRLEACDEALRALER